MKKILYIHQYFKTPYEPGGTRSYWFSKELINRGINIIMITSRNKQKKLVEKVIIDGIKVIYIKNHYDNSFGKFRRILSFIRFMLISSIYVFREKGINLVFTTSTPLTVGIPALLVKKIKQINYIFEVRDLWPDVPLQMNIIRNSLLKKISIWLERKIYSNASHIIALSPGMMDGILNKNIPRKKVSMIPNMAKVEHFYFRKKNETLMKKLGLSSDNFHVIHFGAMGVANGLEYLINTASILNNNHNNIIFLFVGYGGQEKYLKKISKVKSLNNVKFLGNYNMKDLSEIVNLSDCSIVSFLDIPILGTNSPNKLFDSLSAQKPIIVNSAGWTKKLVEDNNCGCYVNPQNPNELADILKKWSNNPNLVCQLGLNSRKLAEGKYDKNILTKQFGDIIVKHL